VATGPTVITPILNVVRVRDHVATALETEGIVNDVTAAIVAVVIFETLLLDDLGVPATLFVSSSGSASACLRGARDGGDLLPVGQRSGPRTRRAGVSVPRVGGGSRSVRSR